MSANHPITENLMIEHVSMPGMSQVIVTRHFCYLWLKSQGYDTKRKGFGSLDYMAFGGAATDEPLTDGKEWDRLLELLADAMSGPSTATKEGE